LHGKYNIGAPPHLSKRVKEIEDGVFDREFDELLAMDEAGLKDKYTKRDFIDQKKAEDDE
jgi:hypothetical protein